MSGLSIYEFDCLAPPTRGTADDGVHTVPAEVFDWLESQCLAVADQGEGAWLRWSRRGGRRAIQVTSFAGVIQAPRFHIEVLPKVGKALEGGHTAARTLLIDMLSCIDACRHVQTHRAKVMAAQVPLLEVFVGEFLRSVRSVVQQGLSSAYRDEEDNLHALRGRLLVSQHLRANLHRPDRFFTAHDLLSTDRAENRVLRAALDRVLDIARSQANMQVGRELHARFEAIPASSDVRGDFAKVRLDRNMGRYRDALDWCRLILAFQSPVAGLGSHGATSLLFPMEVLFEALVAARLREQLPAPLGLKTQARGKYLVRHRSQEWFQLRPDLLVHDGGHTRLVLDTKWKLVDGTDASTTRKYGLAQADFYQLQAYGAAYLNGSGDLVLVYPRTDSFRRPLEVFEFPDRDGMRLWVLPFCLEEKRLILDGLPSSLWQGAPAGVFAAHDPLH